MKENLYKISKKTGIRVHQKPMMKFKEKVKQITSRKRGRAITQICKELKLFTTCWLNYYGLSDMQSKIGELNQWIRRRIRMYIWKQWKRISAKFRNLQMLGIPKDKAWEWANTSKGYWRISHSRVLTTSLTNKYLASIGYDDISKRYEALHLSY